MDEARHLPRSAPIRMQIRVSPRTGGPGCPLRAPGPGTGLPPPPPGRLKKPPKAPNRSDSQRNQTGEKSRGGRCCSPRCSAGCSAQTPHPPSPSPEVRSEPVRPGKPRSPLELYRQRVLTANFPPPRPRCGPGQAPRPPETPTGPHRSAGTAVPAALPARPVLGGGTHRRPGGSCPRPRGSPRGLRGRRNIRRCCCCCCWRCCAGAAAAGNRRRAL